MFQHSVECVVLTPKGEIDFYSAPLLRDRAGEALEVGAVTRLVVDLSHTTFLDSSVSAFLWGR